MVSLASLPAIFALVGCPQQESPPAGNVKSEAKAMATAPAPTLPLAGPLKVGTIAPDFALVDHQGAPVNLDELKGKRALIWFYPKAGTSG